MALGEISRIMNATYADLLNSLLISSNGIRFGKQGETISSVLGKNERSATLTQLGLFLTNILNFISPNHTQRSIKYA